MNREELAKHVAELNFEPQEAVRWLAPAELKTMALSLLSMVFGTYADKRELQQGFDSTLVDLSEAASGRDGAFWLDYTADTGDGFAATFTVASLLAQERLRIPGVAVDLPRGDLLVLGGDEVYPAASARAYEDRLLGPFKSALPHADRQPVMLALPGNHDWYDGLTSFLRIFCQRRAIGGWRTSQTRSYFTVKLPHHWWLVGLDSQLDSYFDDPQLKYFEQTLTQTLSEHDGVIVCCATPAWLKTAEGKADAFNNLDWFERNFIRTRRVPGSDEREETGAEVRLWLSGDKHHYMRYVEQLDDSDAPPGTARQLITCGLGGAYLDLTHGLADQVQLLPQESRSWRDGQATTTFTQQGAVFPTVADSKHWARRLALPWRKEWAIRRNPGLVSFMASCQLVLFVLLMLLFWQGVDATGQRMYDAYLHSGSSELASFAGSVLAVLVLAVLVSEAPRLRGRPPLVSSDVTSLVTSQLLVALGGFVALGALATDRLDAAPGWMRFLLCLVVATAVGGFLAAWALAIWIVLVRGSGLGSWAIMGQAIEEGKGFLRIQISSDGTLTVHPLVTEEILRDYEISPTPVRTTGRPTKIPVPAGPLPTPRLIEAPFQIRREIVNRGVASDAV
ncbi:MAG TPA: metallophosphoesterase [Nocardioides sp.]|uniref:metallophosphoesterase family protein n=1 Tax=Nocardioides sp. TaxID=35761 RepID=UPI002C99BDA5|nr:metallophosphoesterase [Nocardioides sp.]HQR25401.1 metallophosphoesterase [Nocardioides sp.]